MVTAVSERVRAHEGFRPGYLLSALALLCSAALIACESDDSVPGAATGGLTVTGVVKEFKPDIERQQFPAIADVEVCIYGHDDIDCATTSSSGAFELEGLPENSSLLVSFEKKGYAKALRMLTMQDVDYDILAETALASLQLGIQQAMMNGIDLSTFSGGAVQFFAAEPGDGVLQVKLLDGYSAKLTNMDGTPALCGNETGEDAPCEPLYLDENGDPDRSLKASSRIGVGAFGNVAPGKYLLSISHPELACNQHLFESGWEAKDDDSVIVKVIDEWITAQVGAFCEPPE